MTGSPDPWTETRPSVILLAGNNKDSLGLLLGRHGNLDSSASLLHEMQLRLDQL